MGRTNMDEYYFKHIQEKRSINVKEYIENLKTPDSTMLPPGMNKMLPPNMQNTQTSPTPILNSSINHINPQFPQLSHQSNQMRGINNIPNNNLPNQLNPLQQAQMLMVIYKRIKIQLSKAV